VRWIGKYEVTAEIGSGGLLNSSLDNSRSAARRPFMAGNFTDEPGLDRRQRQVPVPWGTGRKYARAPPAGRQRGYPRDPEARQHRLPHGQAERTQIDHRQARRPQSLGDVHDIGHQRVFEPQSTRKIGQRIHRATPPLHHKNDAKFLVALFHQVQKLRAEICCSGRTP
jgi:hypothetical protein